MRARVGLGVDDQPRAHAAVGASGWPPRASRSVRCIVAVVAAWLALAAAPGGAVAQTTSSSLGTLSSPNNAIRMNPNAQGVDRDRPYYTPTQPWWINFEDCRLNDYFTFTLSSQVAGDQLEIWAGSENCAANRSDQDHGQCWIVASQALQDQTVEVRVPVRNIIARRVGVDVPPVGLTADVCDDSNDPSGEALSLYFMVVESGQGDEYFAWDGGTGGFGFDVVGPTPPGSISVGIGESQLAISLDDIPTDNQRERYEAFCVPAFTTRASLGLDAGTSSGSTGGTTPTSADAGDGGLDAGSEGALDAGSGADPDAAPAACPTDLLRVGERPPPEFSCGEGNRTSTRVLTSRLANNTNYAVAVAGQDDLGNVGVISQIQCGRPVPLADFFELYGRAGGLGGGGYCNLSPGQQRTAGALGMATLALALAGLGWRRSRGRA
jgi:hypothetical protein